MGYSHGTQWTEEKIRKEVLQVVNALGIDRMPSRKECEDYFQNTCLTSAVTRKFGWHTLAKELGLEIKKSETAFGKMYESIAAELLTEKGFRVRGMPQNFPYDILINDCVKADVKASRLYKGKIGNFYSFNLEKPFATCDFFILFAINEETTKTMIVPSNRVIANNQISVGENNSRYYKYIDRFDLIRDAVDFWNKVDLRG